MMTESAYRRLEIQAQYAQLRLPGNCPQGVYVSASKDLERWEGVIFIHKGYYEGGVFRFSVGFPPAYPLRAPLLTFAKGCVVHPLVDPKDDRLALASGFPQWSAKTDNMAKVLFFIKGIFKTFHLNRLTEGLAVNGEAWRLYRSGRSTFAKIAAQCAAMTDPSKGRLFEEGGHIEPVFRKLSHDEMALTRQALFGVEEEGGR